LEYLYYSKNKDACNTEFSACGGRICDRIPLRRSAILHGVLFYLTGVSCQIKKGCPKMVSRFWRLHFEAAFIIRTYLHLQQTILTKLHGISAFLF